VTNKLKTIITCILICALALTGVTVPAQAASFPTESNSFGKDYLIEETDQSAPFFEKVLPNIEKNLKKNNKHSINPYFDKLPKANNPENFQGLDTTSYANINGKKVTVEGFYRVKNESLHDPNAGMGLLIYQCIQYKLANPEKKVEITFSSYRTSATAAVCVLPESKYYGYMRSLYTTNYDEHGFVRISYMLTEAARMGINVTLVNQLPSYKVKHYNPQTQKLEKRSLIHFEDYYEKALKTACYKKYASGKNVSDYMDFVVVDWPDVSRNMQHVKSCTVSHYLDTKGKVHKNAVFFTSSNLDENDYLGRNGNGLSQSGVIITNHSDLYRVTKNYTKLMKKYSYADGIDKFREIVIERNKKQTKLIESGKEDEIPANEQIIYLGTPKDKVFKLMFTPIIGETDTWDIENNPLCYHIDNMMNSEDYIQFAYNVYAYEKSNLGKAIGTMLEKAFCENKNPENVISVKANSINLDKIKELKIGEDIKLRSIEDGSKVHAKDMYLSYLKDGVRHRVAIITSCNQCRVGFHTRTNSILTIDETDATGGDFYEMMTPKYTDNVISFAEHKHDYVNKTIPATLKEKGQKVSICKGCEKIREVKATYYSPKTFKLSKKTYTYNKNYSRKPSVTVKDSKGKTLKKGTDYTVSYEKGRKKPGQYTVKITFKGKYSGTKKLYFNIKPRATKEIKATPYKKTVKLSWTKVTGADGYRVYKYNSETKEFEKIATVKKGTTYKVKDLKSKRTYKFKVRAYTKDDGETIWGVNSKVKSVKTK